MRLKSRLIKSLLIYINNKRFSRPLLFGLVCIAITFWYGLTTAVQSNIRFRLEKEEQRVESALTGQLNEDASVLFFMRAYFDVHGVPRQDDFSPLVKNLIEERIKKDLEAIGYIPIIQNKDLEDFKRHQRWFFSQHQIHPVGTRSTYAPLFLVEPITAQRKILLGYDLFTDERRASGIQRAIDAGQPVISRPLRPLINPSANQQFAFILAEPVYEPRGLSRDLLPIVPTTLAERRAKIRGVLYVPLRVNNFFEVTFGKPQVSKELVNYRIEFEEDNGSYQEIYRRFASDSGRKDYEAERTVDLYGRRWKITTTPLPQFFTNTDLYLANVVGLVLAVLVGLLLLVVRLTREQLVNERRAKELITESARISREKTERLKRLNQINKTTPVQLELDKLVSRFFDASIQISQATHSFLYFGSEREDDESWKLHDFYGFQKEDVVQSSVLAQGLDFLEQKYITKIDEFETNETLAEFTTIGDHFVDWIMITVPSRDGKKCGLLFLGKTQGGMFSENDLEMIESLVFQTGIAIDNSKLFKKVEDSNHAKTAFLANMSHEIRTPLNAIIGFSEILGETETAEQRESLLEVIKRNGSQLTSIIDDILDLSKIEAGKLYIDIRKVQLGSVLNEVRLVMEMRAQAKGISFGIENRASSINFISTDEVRLKQILMNLAGNAIKFTEKGSVEIIVSIERGEKEALVFEVIDTGIGISAETRPHLFQAFSQGDMSTTRRFGGTGLGLALSARLARELGGNVTLEDSTKDTGSRFKAKIALLNPVLKGDEKPFATSSSSMPAIADQAPRQELKDLRVLLVEDSPDNQDIFNYFLKANGAKTETVDNGEDAVREALTFRYDFILMDIQIPKIDGLEATRRIRAQGFREPIIALTAHAFPEEKQNCMSAGCNGLITKPVTRESLIGQIFKIMEDHRHDNEYRHTI